MRPSPSQCHNLQRSMRSMDRQVSGHVVIETVPEFVRLMLGYDDLSLDEIETTTGVFEFRGPEQLLHLPHLEYRAGEMVDAVGQILDRQCSLYIPPESRPTDVRFFYSFHPSTFKKQYETESDSEDSDLSSAKLCGKHFRFRIPVRFTSEPPYIPSREGSGLFAE
ncbi:hypothetical protein L218DRAFT_989479 [Marasmius fiardii PR-910]|nr:hypothetical protein L218DRAFT_989479 [Marasmius fiardii PR-910]